MIESVSTGYGEASKDYYYASFGNYPDLQPYSAGMNRMYKAQLKGLEPRKAITKSLNIDAEAKSLQTTTGGTGTAGNALIPVYLDPRVVDISRKYTPLTELIPRVANQGTTADYIRVTAKGSAGTNVEDAALSDVAHTRSRVSKSIKYLYSVGRVTGPAQAAIPAFTFGGYNPTGAGNVNESPFSDAQAPNAMQQEVLLAARALKEFEENLIINGNATTNGVSGNTGPDGSEYDGIVQLQSTTNQTDLSGADITWDNIQNAVKEAYSNGGRPNLAICSASTYTDITSLMIDTFRITPGDNVTELVFGISAQVSLNTIVGMIPLIPSMFLDDTADSRSVYFLDMDWIEMRVLLDMTFEELAKTNDSRKFMLKIYEVLIMRAPEFNACIVNID